MLIWPTAVSLLVQGSVDRAAPGDPATSPNGDLGSVGSGRMVADAEEADDKRFERPAVLRAAPMLLPSVPPRVLVCAKRQTSDRIGSERAMRA